MTTLYQWLESETEGASIEAIVFGEMGWHGYNEEAFAIPGPIPKGVLLTLEQAMPWLNIEFDAGFGSPGCPAMYAWTSRRVYFVTQYDGATSLDWVPRDPTATIPIMPGG